ncbi:MAG: hypothetical protein HC907_38680, partial [Richelia sp. SM1_7_0]|nr:hypothetical protein [Richelia sp. SM1_7_0]
MTLQEVQKQALQLPIDKRWQLVQSLLESLNKKLIQRGKKEIYLGYEVLLKIRQYQIMKTLKRIM